MANLRNEWLNEDINSFLVNADEKTLSVYKEEIDYLSNHETETGEDKYDDMEEYYTHQVEYYASLSWSELIQAYRSDKYFIKQAQENLISLIELEIISDEIRKRTTGMKRLFRPVELL